MKRKLVQVISLILCILFAFSLSGCSQAAVSSQAAEQTAADDGTNAETSVTTSAIGEAILNSAQEIAANAASESSDIPSDSTGVVMSGTGFTVTGSGASVSGNTLTISNAGCYLISGTLTDGQIIVNAGEDDTVRLILNGASITCLSSAPIYCEQAGKLIITVADGSENQVTDSGNYPSSEDAPDAAIYSKSDLMLNGGGALTITANYNNGICSKDNLAITNGSISVTAVNDALRGRDCVVITGGTFDLTAGSDGIQSNNDEDSEKGFISISGGTFQIASEGDGIQAESALMVSDGSFTIQTSASSTADSYKGLKASGSLLITGGRFTITSADDALHSNNALEILNGEFLISSQDDGMHADNTLVIDDGTITITQSYEGLEGASVTVNGGVLNIVSTDDGINAAGGNDASSFGRAGDNSFSTDSSCFILITGGIIQIDASGDGIDSNGTLTIEGGEITVSGPTNNGNGSLDSQGTFTVSGGVLVAAGSSGMAQAPDNSSTQNSISFTLESIQQGGSSIELRDASGNVIAAYTPNKQYQSVIVSSPDINQGETYSLFVDGNEITTVSASGVTTVTGSAAAGQMERGGMRPNGGEMPGGAKQPLP